jgi:hypothetical protein
MCSHVEAKILANSDLFSKKEDLAIAFLRDNIASLAAYCSILVFLGLIFYSKAVKRRSNVTTHSLSQQFLKICCGPEAISGCPVSPYNSHSSDSIQKYVDFAMKICHGDGDPRHLLEVTAWDNFLDFLSNVRIGGQVYACARSPAGECFILVGLVRRLQKLHVKGKEAEMEEEIEFIKTRVMLAPVPPPTTE